MKNWAKIILVLSGLLAGAAEAATATFTASGNWTAPAGVTLVTVEAWGGGGAGGGNNTSSDGGGGGGGGAYSMVAITVIPGTVYTVTVGAGGIAVSGGAGGAGGDSWFSTAATILAKGGAGGALPAGGAGGVAGVGGAAASGIGTSKFSGGDGGTGRNSGTGRGGPGGSSAGTAVNGTSGPLVWNTATALAPPPGGGIGGDGGNANGQDGFAPASGNGGGGGGGAERTTAGGNGAPGRVSISYPSAGPVTYYHDTTAGVVIGVDGPTNVVANTNVAIPPVITASLITANTCTSNARSNNHPSGSYTHSRWYLTSNYMVATDISANPTGSARLRGGSSTDTVTVSLYDYDPVSGTKALIGSSSPITLTNFNTTTNYPYTITSSLYTVLAGHRLMLQYDFNQTGLLGLGALYNARVYCSSTGAYITVTETPVFAPDHLEIQSAGSGLTCAANTLTIKACADAACNFLYTAGVFGTLSATGAGMTVNWDGTTGGATGAGFVIPSGSSLMTKNVQVATAGIVTFGMASATPAYTCNFGNNAPANNNCVFTAKTAGFIFSDSATGNTTYTIPSLTSGSAQNTNNLLWLRAVQASTANAAVCTPAITSQTVSVDMGYTCNNPNACQTGSLGVINGTAIASAGTAVSLAFDSSGSSPITSVRYDDVGQVTLNANKTVIPFPGGTAIMLNGSSNAFIVKPHHFDLTSIQQTAAPNLVNPAAADAAGAKFVKAGEQFSVTVTAKNLLNAPTPNFGKEASAEGVKLSATLVAPAGGNNPAISGTFGAFSNGAATADGITFLPDGVTRSTPFTWNEVGIITLTPSVADGSYLGAGDVTGAASGNVGRFYPDHFNVSIAAASVMPCPTGLTCPCPPQATCPPSLTRFVYSGQQFSANVFARNAADQATRNYDGALGFAKAVTLIAVDVPGGSASSVGSITSATSTVAASSFVSGTTGAGTPAAPVYAFTSTPTLPTDVYLRATESSGGDGVSSLRSPADTSWEQGIKVVNGRMKIFNAYGSELLPLTLTATAQYYTASGWVNSITDSATNLSLAASYPVGAGSTAVTLVPSTGNLSGGTLNIKLGAPGVAGTATITPTAAPSYLPVTSGTATFGVYKGNNSYIYRREN